MVREIVTCKVSARCFTKGSSNIPAGYTGRVRISTPPRASRLHSFSAGRYFVYWRIGRKSVTTPS